MLRQFRVVPARAIGEIEPLDHVNESAERQVLVLVFQDDRIERALDAHGDRCGIALALKHEIGPAQIVAERQDIIARCEEVIVVIGDDVAAIVAAIDVGVVLRPAGQNIVAGTAVEHVVVVEAEQQILAVGLSILQREFHDVDVGHVSTVIEQHALDRIGEQQTEDRHIDPVELVLNDQAVPVGSPFSSRMVSKTSSLSPSRRKWIDSFEMPPLIWRMSIFSTGSSVGQSLSS